MTKKKSWHPPVGEDMFSKDELRQFLTQKIRDCSRELLRHIDLLKLVQLMPEQSGKAGDDG